MWEKRPYGQLAKCAEAQALRKAFPEILGGMVTSEEMEGKGFDNARIVSAESKVDNIREKARADLYNIDGKFVEASEVHTMVMDKIDSITSNDDLEAYEEWKHENQSSLSAFVKKNRDLAMEYADIIQQKRETLAGSSAE
jgi:hypothetical protein